MSLLSSSSVRSELTDDSVDHGGKQVDAAAVVLLWVLVADRYILISKLKVACLCEGGVLAQIE